MTLDPLGPRRWVVGLWLAPLFTIPVGALAQDELAAIELILEYSLVDNVLEGQATAFLVALEQVVGSEVDLESAGVERVVGEEFALDRMRKDVVDLLRESSVPVVLEEVSELLSTSSIAQVSDLLADYEPPETLEAFVQTLQAKPPPRERVALLAGLAEAQQAAGFYLLLDETTREGAHELAAVLTEDRSPPYDALEDSVAEEQLERGHQFAVVSFLHRYRPVEDTLIASATSDYRTRQGQWYVENYSLALAGSIRRAALRVVERLDVGVSEPLRPSTVATLPHH